MNLRYSGSENSLQIKNRQFARETCRDVALLEKMIQQGCEVEYDRCRFLGTSYLLLISFLMRRMYITKLHLIDCDLLDIHVSFLLKNVEYNDQLIDLSFKCNPEIGDKGVIICAEFLQTNTTLRHLSLEKTGMTSDSIVAISKAIETNTSLLTLDLSSNIVFSFSDTALMYSLIRNKTLISISFYNTFMFKIDITRLLACLDMNLTLREFQFSASLVDKKVYNKLVAISSKGNIISFGVDIPSFDDISKEFSAQQCNAYLSRNRRNREHKESSLKEILLKHIEVMRAEKHQRKRTKKMRTGDEQASREISTIPLIETISPPMLPSRLDSHFIPVVDDV
jgi:hypothetical protein